MIEAILALALAATTAKPIQQADVHRYVRDYNAAVNPYIIKNAKLHTEWGSGFELGSDKAIKLSALALATRDLCNRSVTRLGRVEPPTLLTEAHRKAFSAYHAQKVALYMMRCREAQLIVAYIDEPLKPSNRAALERSSVQDNRIGTTAGKRLQPVFRQIGITYPKDWA